MLLQIATAEMGVKIKVKHPRTKQEPPWKRRPERRDLSRMKELDGAHLKNQEIIKALTIKYHLDK